MARAFLKLADEVRDAFVAAQAPESTVRVIAVDIADEDTLVVAFTEEETGKGEQEDFNTLLQLRVSADKPLVLLFRLDEDSTVSPSMPGRYCGHLTLIDESSPFSHVQSGAGGAKKWLFITWVPDASKVRQKMLFSSSKIDLKEGLGLNYFRGEYHASEKSEVTSYGSQSIHRGPTDKLNSLLLALSVPCCSSHMLLTTRASTPPTTATSLLNASASRRE
jgi:hypothetical protein